MIEIPLFVFMYNEFIRNEPNSEILYNFKRYKNGIDSKIKKSYKEIIFISLIISIIFLIINIIQEIIKLLIYPYWHPRFTGGIEAIIIFIDILLLAFIYRKQFILFFNGLVIYSTVIVKVLYSMLIITGWLTLIYLFRFVSWFFADPTIIYASTLRFSWLNSRLNLRFIQIDRWIMFKIVIFIIGLIIFTTSFSQLVFYIKKYKTLVRKGVYKVIRHPQNFSIILMVFPLFFPSDNKIFIGDLLSWTQIAFIIIIYSDIEDLKLKKKFPYEFDNYRRNTGFMVPKLFKIGKRLNISLFKNKKVRYSVLILIYIIATVLIYWFYQIYPFRPDPWV